MRDAARAGMLPNAVMRASIFAVCLVCACDASVEPDAARLEFFVPDTEEPMRSGAELSVYLRPQGVYGASIDLHVIGIAPDVSFAIAIESASSGDLLADQGFLPTSLARELDDGSWVIRGLPIVFFDAVGRADVDAKTATVVGEMESMPPTTGACDVVLVVID